MRTLLIVFSLLLGTTLLADETPEVTIDGVVWHYKPEQTFKRIGEYLDGVERTGRKTIVRSQSEGPRRGLYFIVRIDKDIDELPAGTSFEIDMLRSDQRKPMTQKFPLPAEAQPHREVWLGYTGEDIPPNDEPPVAWRVRMIGPDGQEITTYQSFLWSKPAGNVASD